MNILLGIVDDHELFLKSVSLLLSGMPGIAINLEALNGEELLQKLKVSKVTPDIILIDVNMPVMDGFTTASILSEEYPAIKLVALSMNDDDRTIIRMIKAGCCSYFLKDIHPLELEKGLHQIALKGYYNSDQTNINYRRLLVSEENEAIKLTDKETKMLQRMCSDKPYKQIASEAGISERTVDSYREVLFTKLNVQSRVGLVLEAIRKKLVEI
jgi:DNA-binding NarL/FixJ family response regulator